MGPGERVIRMDLDGKPVRSKNELDQQRKIGLKPNFADLLIGRREPGREIRRAPGSFMKLGWETSRLDTTH